MAGPDPPSCPADKRRGGMKKPDRVIRRKNEIINPGFADYRVFQHEMI